MADPTPIDGPAGLAAAIGTTFGPGEWVKVDQARIDLFAEATGDDQWIHVDPVRAADGPFGGTIAHGYLTLSLTNWFLPRLGEVRGFSSGVNYGVDRVRFPAAVPVGSRLRASAELLAADEVPGGVQTTMRITVECDAAERPVCVVDALSRWLV